MRIRLAQSDFLRMLQTVIDAVPSRPTLPVLSMIMLRAEEGGCTLSATDLELSIRTSHPCEPLEEGAATFPGRKVHDIVRELAAGELTIGERDGRFTLTSATGEYSLLSMPVEEFPTIPTQIDGTTFAIDGELLKRMTAKVAFAAHPDQTHPTLSGVNWRVSPSATTMVATDTHRLAKITERVSAAQGQNIDVIVSPRILQSAVKLLNAGGTTAQDNPLERVTVGERQIRFAFARADMVARLTEGTYADVDAVIPRDNDRHLIVASDVFVPAVRRVQVLSSQQNHQIRLALRSNEVELTAMNRDTGAEARELVEAEYNGEPMEVGYNATYLHDVLRTIAAQRVRFKFREPTSAAIVEPAEQSEGEEYFCLVMPLRLMD